MWGISRLAEELFAFYEKLWSMVLVGPSERWLDGRSAGRLVGRPAEWLRISEVDSTPAFRWMAVKTRIPALWLLCILILAYQPAI
jgi:hypothetical protein